MWTCHNLKKISQSFCDYSSVHCILALLIGWNPHGRAEIKIQESIMRYNLIKWITCQITHQRHQAASVQIFIKLDHEYRVYVGKQDKVLHRLKLLKKNQPPKTIAKSVLVLRNGHTEISYQVPTKHKHCFLTLLWKSVRTTQRRAGRSYVFKACSKDVSHHHLHLAESLRLR